VTRLAKLTLALAALVVAGCLAVGFGAAFAVTRCDIPLRRTFSVLLCLPFAIPSYLLAGMAIKAAYHPAVPSPANLGGAALVLVLTLVLWVYLPAKVGLVQQGRQYHEVARSLGLSPWQRWWRIQVWLLLPTLAAGALLVFMAVLNDFGTVSLLDVKTLSVGIHDAAFSMYRRDWAAQLALIGLALPVIAVVLFAIANARRASYQVTNRAGELPLIRLPAAARWGVVGALATLLLASLAWPVLRLVQLALTRIGRMPLTELPGQAWDTVFVTALVTAITLVLAVTLGLVLRRGRGMALWRKAGVVINLNYALPGIMLGISLLFASAVLPEWLSASLLSNSVGLLVIGGCLAFLCFPFFAIQAGLAAVPRDVDDLCRVLALGPGARLLRIDLPLLARGIACGALLVVVTMAKELPLSQALQPFGFQSLSMRLYGFAGLGMLEEGAIYSLSLIALVTWPIVTLDRLIMRSADAPA